MKGKNLKVIMVLAVVLLTVSILGACGSADAPDSFAAGNASASESQQEGKKPSVTDGRFTVTLEKTVALEDRLGFAYSVAGVTEEAEAELMAEGFDGSVAFYSSLQAGEYESIVKDQLELTALRTESKKYFSGVIVWLDEPPELPLSFRLKEMEGFHYIELPLEASEEVLKFELPLASGMEAIIHLNPLNITIEKEFPKGYEGVVENTEVFFRMTDGSIKTFQELFYWRNGHYSEEDPSRYQHYAEARTILDLSQFQSVIVRNLEYDLSDPAQGKEVELDERLHPFAVELISHDNEQMVPLVEVMARLGGEVLLDETGRHIEVRYRGSAVGLEIGRNDYQKDGISYVFQNNSPLILLDGETLLMNNFGFWRCFHVAIGFKNTDKIEERHYIIP